MDARRHLSLGHAAALLAAALPADAGRPRRYQDVVARVANMVSDPAAHDKVARRGLQILNVMWEDTGRWQGSSVGPNISDVTIEVEVEHGRHKRTHLMPVIRHDNFTDKTADVKLDQFFVRVGNEREGRPLRTISLRELLEHPTEYMSLPDRGRIKGGTLLARRDRHALVSAQTAFLPIRDGGQATFWPVIFNYQSSRKNPAVLTILVTRQGTSMTIVDNARDTVSGGASWGQRLFFNAGGQRAPLTAERKADVVAKGVTANGEDASSLGEDANVMMIIQVPLKYREQPRRSYLAFGLEGAGVGGGGVAAGAPMSRATRGGSDVDVAVIGHGPELGPYTELDGLTIERDPRFPVRVTVQFYQATSNGVLSRADVTRFARQIRRVYAKGDYVGSLVVGKTARPTMWDGIGPRPAGVTWRDFPGLVERVRTYGTWLPWRRAAAPIAPPAS